MTGTIPIFFFFFFPPQLNWPYIVQTFIGGTRVYNRCTHVWTKNLWKGVFLAVKGITEISHSRAWKCLLLGKGKVVFTNLVSLGGQTWCETAQNACLELFSWEKLELVSGVFWKPMFMHVYTQYIWMAPWVKFTQTVLSQCTSCDFSTWWIKTWFL